MLRNLLAMIVIGALSVVGYVFGLSRDLPSVEQALQDGINPTQWTQILAADGTPIMSFGKFHHDSVPLEEVSDHFINALLATEDRRFYSHQGIDPVAIARAILSDITHKSFREGGSTITQQLARNVFLSNERSLTRKIREALLAVELEKKLTKDQILELYINNIYLGEGAYGIKAASEVYFNKHPSRLTLEEGALLAGLPQAPSSYSPFHNPESALRRRNEVLENLGEVGQLTAEQVAQHQANPIQLSEGGRNLSSSDKAPFFNRHVMNQVMRYFNLDEQSFWQSGLKIHTTLDLRAQAMAENAVINLSRSYGRTGSKQQAALIAINPQTGSIMAYVGGKNYQNSQFDRVSQAVRSPGSLFKIFTYATAIDRGHEPTRVYLDEPFQLGDWRPTNYDKGHHGYMTIARALITSNNIVAVKVIHELGPESVIQMARQMGVRSKLEPYAGLTLGGSGVTLIEITSAFGVLANQGVRVEPHAIDRVIDDTGKEIYREHPVKTNVLNRETVDTMVKMMAGVIERGTGRAADIGRPAAGKTGTSDENRDAWFVGFTPDLVTGVWVGNDDNSRMGGMTGGGLPAVIWKSFMGRYLAGRPPRMFDLAYSKALDEQDYVTYSLNNLSTGENPNAVQPNELGENGLPLDPLVDPLTGEQMDPTASPGYDPLTGAPYPSTHRDPSGVSGPSPHSHPTPQGRAPSSAPLDPLVAPGGTPPPTPTAPPSPQPAPRAPTPRIEPTDAHHQVPAQPGVTFIQPDGNRNHRSPY